MPKLKFRSSQVPTWLVFTTNLSLVQSRIRFKRRPAPKRPLASSEFMSRVLFLEKPQNSGRHSPGGNESLQEIGLTATLRETGGARGFL